MNERQIIDNFLYVSEIYLRLTEKKPEDLSTEEVEKLLKTIANKKLQQILVDQVVN